MMMNAIPAIVPAYFAGPTALAEGFLSGALALESSRGYLDTLEGALETGHFDLPSLRQGMARYRQALAKDIEVSDPLRKKLARNIFRDRHNVKKMLEVVRKQDQDRPPVFFSRGALLAYKFLDFTSLEKRTVYESAGATEPRRRYYPIGPIGNGGFGRIYLGRDEDGRKVAIKVLEGQKFSQADYAKEAFLQEINALCRLIHPNIVEMTDWNTDSTPPFLVMEYVEGTSLHHRIQSGPLPWPIAKTVALQLASALAVVHAERLVHSDLKSNDILLPKGETDNIRVVDFGIVDDLENRKKKTDETVVLGTPIFMAPEQICGDPVDHRTDIYALGVLLYEMLAGRPPFIGLIPAETCFMHIQNVPPPFRFTAPGIQIPPGAEALVFKALAKQREARFQTMVQLFAALQACGGE